MTAEIAEKVLTHFGVNDREVPKAEAGAASTEPAAAVAGDGAAVASNGDGDPLATNPRKKPGAVRPRA